MDYSEAYLTAAAPPPRVGDPTWAMAYFYPAQGSWTEEQYLALGTGRLMELSDGIVEVLPMPNAFHQLIVEFLHAALKAYLANGTPGRAMFAPLPVRLWPGTYREPDIVYVRPERLPDLHRQPNGADLVMEVVSEGAENRLRDLVEKRQDYAAAGIPEYWIVDPEERRITVLTLDGTRYRVHGEFGEQDRATSVLLPGFSVAVAAVFDAGNAIQ